jgi:hypothetical protein
MYNHSEKDTRQYLLILNDVQILLRPLVLWFCWRRNIKDNKKNMTFLLVWNKDSYTGRFLVLFPCICVLQLKLVHLYHTSSLLPRALPFNMIFFLT